MLHIIWTHILFITQKMYNYVDVCIFVKWSHVEDLMRICTLCIHLVWICLSSNRVFSNLPTHEFFYLPPLHLISSTIFFLPQTPRTCMSPIVGVWDFVEAGIVAVRRVWKGDMHHVSKDTSSTMVYLHSRIQETMISHFILDMLWE